MEQLENKRNRTAPGLAVVPSDDAMRRFSGGGRSAPQAIRKTLEINPILIHQKEAASRVIIGPAGENAPVVNLRDHIGKGRIEASKRPS